MSFSIAKNMVVASTDTAAQASCESTLVRVAQSLLFLWNNLGSLLVKNSSIANSNFFLKYLQSLVQTKVHDVGVKPKSTTVEELTYLLDSIKRHTKFNKRCWTGSFFKTLQSYKSKIVGQLLLTWERLLCTLHSKQDSGSIARQLERQCGLQVN